MIDLKILNKIRNNGRDVPFLRGRIHFFILCFYPILFKNFKIDNIPEEVKYSILIFFFSYTYSLITCSLLHNNQLYIYRSAYKRIDISSIFLIISASALPLNVHYMKEDGVMALITVIQWILTFIGVFWSLVFDFCCYTKEFRSIFHFILSIPNLYLIYRIYISGPKRALIGIFLEYLLGVIGSVVYCTESPYLIPGIFGHHELFHLLCVMSFGCIVLTIDYVLSVNHF